MDSAVQLFNPSHTAVAGGYPDWYNYPFDFVITGSSSGVNATATIQIDASAQFFWTQLSYQAITAANGWNQQTNPVPAVKILITDGGSQKNLMAAPIFLNALAGVGGWPYRLQHPRLFDRNSSVTMTITSYDPTVFTALQIVMGGFRVYGG